MTNGTFKQGEIALLCNVPFPFSVLNGQECEILATLAPQKIVDIYDIPDVTEVYIIKACGCEFAAKPKQLKKKPKPPTIDDAEFGKTVEWGDCAWKPEQVGA